MKLTDLADNPGSRKTRKRVGRGIGSGKGKTCGHGTKGQKARTGVAINGFEGGQMPIYRRLPKRGFTNPFTRDIAEITLAVLDRAVTRGNVDAKQPVTEDALRAAGLVKKQCSGVRLLANGELKAKLTIEITAASKTAIAAVEKAGGSVTVKPRKARPEGKGRARDRKRKERAETAEKKYAEAAEKAKKKAGEGAKSKPDKSAKGKSEGKPEAKAKAGPDAKGGEKPAGKPQAKPGGHGKSGPEQA
ncbi:MAG: 50S ribosomal protein L15 [Rhodospirillales bacterium]|nr:50S ribosomal protein L15 [Rhodospirillales bacterium]